MRERLRYADRGRSVLSALRERISNGLASGALEHGDRLPSVRELGDELDADPRVVLAAYEKLAEEELVELRSRSGAFVVSLGTPASESGLPHRWLIETLAGAIQRDISPDRLIEHIRGAMVARRARAAIIECNSDQLHSMRDELQTYFGVEVSTIDLETISPEAPSRALEDAHVLVSAGHADAVARIARALGKPYVITRVRPALVARLSRLLARGPLYFIVADPRFGAKMRRLIAPMPGSENFHALVVNQDDLRVIPSGAPTYAMGGTRARFNGKDCAGRVIMPQRIFCAETSREILGHILRVTGGQAFSAP